MGDPINASGPDAGGENQNLQIPVWRGSIDVPVKPSRIFHRFVSDDLSAFTDRMCSLFKPHDIILSHERISEASRFELDYVELGADLLMSKVTYGRKVSIEAPPLEQFFVFQFTLDGVCVNTFGSQQVEATPRSLCSLNLGRPVKQDMSPGYRQIAIRVSRGLLVQTLEEELGYRVRDQLQFASDAVSLDGSAATLAGLVSNVWNDLQRADSGYDQHVVRDRTNRAIAALLLAALPHNYTDLFAWKGGGATPFFVRKAEIYMREHAADNITSNDIADHVGVSVRTLQNGFRNFRTTTPMTFLKSIRLHSARAGLLKSHATKRNVTEIAMDCGFTHLSKFAQDYRQQFGESPSEMARRGTLS
jgi:AraC-like DNA-binding protein